MVSLLHRATINKKVDIEKPNKQYEIMISNHIQ